MSEIEYENLIQQYSDIIDEQHQQILDLKTRVRELESDIRYNELGDYLVELFNNENRQLKQQLQELPKKIVDEIKKVLRERCEYKYLKDKEYPNLLIDWHDIVPILSNLLKKYEEK